MIPHSFIQSQLKSWPISTIKMHMHRQRNRLSILQLAFYCNLIFKHQLEQATFFRLYQQLSLTTRERLQIPRYASFMKQIQAVAPLIRPLSQAWAHAHAIQSSRLWNAVDTTLIPEKEPESITSADWAAQRVTTRTKHKNKVRICGSKGLFFLNRHGFITYAERLPINASDQNILKDSAFYTRLLKGFLLADRGFQNKLVRKRFADLPNCKLISPYLKKQKEQLTEQERKLYRFRWKIETLFQTLKYAYAPVALNLKGKYTQPLKEAKFYAVVLCANVFRHSQIA